MKRWRGKVHAGGWPDADMLPFGHIGIRAERGNDRASLLKHDEQYTLMSLWSIFRSPLMMGGDLPTSDAFTCELLTNAEVLAVDQQSDNGREIYRQGGTIVWTADDPKSGAKYVGIFNIEDSPQAVDLPWSKFGVPWAKPAVRDLWQHKDGGRVADVHLMLRPHANVLYRIVQ